MSIKAKIAFIFFTAVVLMVLTLVVLSNNIFQSKFKQLERAEISKNEKVFNNAITTELNRLNLISKDWGQWTDSFDYINSRHKEYEIENLSHTSLSNLQIDLIAYTKNDKVFKSLDILEDKVVDSTRDFTLAIQNEPLLLNFNSSQKGIIDLKDHGLWLVATGRITNSSQKDLRNANLILAKKFDENFLKEIENTIQVPVRRVGISKDIINNIREKGKFLYKYSHLKILNGNNFIYSIKHYPSIVITGKKSFITFISLATFFVSIILGFAYFILDKRIFRKIISLIEKISSLDVSNLERVEVDNKNSNKEILNLTNTINELIERVLQDYDLLVQKGKFESLGLMAGGVAHEINNPITVIKMNSTKIIKAINNGEEINTEELKYKLEKNLSNINRITGIITGMKKLSRQSATDKFITTSANELVSDVQALEAGIIADKDIQTEYVLLKDDVVIEGLPPQIIQILINLIVNAAHAITEHQEKWIKIEVSKSNGFVNFNVTDSGNGVSEENRKKIMDPFFTTKEVGKGTGLGLSICKKIALFHKGELILDTSSKNTKFILSIPVFTSEVKKLAS